MSEDLAGQGHAHRPMPYTSTEPKKVTICQFNRIAMGAAYLFALLGITRFQKRVDGFRRETDIDEQ
ncbi:MAG: hypothetical protein J6W09_08185 [Bacteroidales bacterium]|nr:hypothetical protein [Bacteroidales bacterium]